MEIFALIVWFFCGIGAAMIAQSKGRSGLGWFIAGVLFGPLALLVIGFMAPAPGTPVTEFWPSGSPKSSSEILAELKDRKSVV